MNINIDWAGKDMWLFLFSVGGIKGTLHPKINYMQTYLPC